MRFLQQARNNFPILCLCAVCAIFLPTWTLTLELEDIKYLVAFVLFPFLLIASYFWNGHTHAGARNKAGLAVGGIFLAYCGYLLCNWYFLSYPYYGTRGMVYQWFCLSSLVIGALFANNRGWCKAAIAGCIVCGVVSSLYAIAEYLSWIPYYSQGYWPPIINGLFAHKNPFGMFIMVSSMATAYLLYLNRSRMRNMIVLLAALLLQLVALLVSDSRGALVLTIIAFCAVFGPIAYKTGAFKNAAMRFVFYGGMLVCLCIPIFMWSETFWVRAASSIVQGNISESNRAELYKAEKEMIGRNPVFGFGVGNFINDNVGFWSKQFKHRAYLFQFARNAENDYLETLIETGVVGLCFYLFFICGALLLAIRQLRKKWDWIQYILLIFFSLMLINGMYDVSLRRLPHAIIFFSIVGYFWRDSFNDFFQIIRSSRRTWCLAGIGISVHCLLAFFFLRICLADYFYLNAVALEHKQKKYAGIEIKKALDICPAHPDALYKAASLAVLGGQYDYAFHALNRIDSTSPNIRPTDYLRALALCRQYKCEQALPYLDAEIEKTPKFIEPYKLKIQALSFLHRCGEMKKFQARTCSPLRDQKDFFAYYDTVSAATIQREFLLSTGKIRAFFGGAPLYNAYLYYRDFMFEKYCKDCSRLQSISEIACAEK